MKRYAIVVDAYSSGKWLAPLFSSESVECIHVQSTQEISPFDAPSFSPGNFVSNHIFRNVESLRQELLRYPKIDLVVAGCESGVMIADQLSEAFGTPSNGTRLSAARRNKYLMSEALRKSGLRTAKQMITDDTRAAFDFYDNLAKPIVVKPVSSCGAEDVTFCFSKADISRAFERILGKENTLGEPNRSVLVQEAMFGMEYIVNTASAAGHHYIAEIWRCHKDLVPNRGLISRVDKLVDPNNRVADTLSEYCRRSLDALEIQHGPGHFEIMYTAEGPTLIEVAARMVGSINMESVNAAKGESHPTLAIDSYLRPETIINRSKRRYVKRKNMFHCYMRAPAGGTLVDDMNVAALDAIESVFWRKVNFHRGDRVPETVDLMTSPGLIDFVSDCIERLEIDLQLYLAVEAHELFRFA